MTSFIMSAYRAVVGKAYADIYEAAEKGDIKFLKKNVKDLCAQDDGGNTILHKAARSGQTEVVEWAMKEYPKDFKTCLTIKAKDSATALHLAAIFGNDKLIGRLLDAAGDDVHAIIDVASTRANLTPLHLAAYVGSSAAVKVLMGRGANPLALTNEKQTPLHIAAARTISSVPTGHNHDAVVEELLKDRRVLEKVVQTGQASARGYSPLLYACYGGSETCAELLIEAGAPLTKFTIKQRLPLHAAAIYGHIKIVKMLLEVPEGKPAVLQTMSNSKKNALFFAVESGSVELLELFLETMKGLGKNPKTDLDASLLEAAAKFGHVGVAKIILSYSAPIDTDDAKKHPLTIAASKGHKDVFFEILKKYPELKLPTFEDGTLFFHIAAEGGSLDIVNHVLKAQSDVLHSTNKGISALDVAAKYGNLAVVKFFLDKRVEFDTILNAGFYIAAKNGYLDILEEGLKKVSGGWPWWTKAYPVDVEKFKFQVLCGAADGGQDNIVKLLLNTYTAPMTSASGDSALHIAASRGRVSTVELLLQLKADANYRKDEFNVLHTAVFYGQKQVIELLLNRGFHIEARSGPADNPLGSTPLHVAVDRTRSPYRKHYLSTVKFLLEKGADVNAKIGGNKNTALHQAALSANSELAALLLEMGADINAINAEKDTPLHLAAGAKSTPLRVVQVLLSSKHIIETTHSKNEKGQTPAMLAVAAKKPETVKLLEASAKGRSPDFTAEEGEGSDSKRQKLASDEAPLDAEEILKAKSFYDRDDLSAEPEILDQDWLEASSQLEVRLKRLQSYPKNAGKEELSMLEADDQIGCYLGNMVEMKEYMKEKEKDTHTLKSSKALELLRKHPEWYQDKKLGRWLKKINTNLAQPFNIDHIVPDSLGGIDHPNNYFLLCGSINSSFSNWYTKEKEVYMGKKVMKAARDFAKWAKVKHQKETCYNDYDFERGVL